MDYYYVVSSKDNSADQLLHMLWGFRDFRITGVKYSAINNTIDVLFEYDNRQLYVLLQFQGHVHFYVECVDFEDDWVYDATLHEYKNNQLRWIKCEVDESEYNKTVEGVTYFQGNTIKWAIVNKDGNTLPVPDDLLHQRIIYYNYETKQYEEEYHDFTVTLA
ncbi:MAG: hypothetical protein LUG60_07440 [Erysipelotrichaceae bacterium]|nr:hypothetical protein [Erysipelotrichaceae bacterium]